MTRRVVLITRTRYDEPPRLRHQVAQLLAAHGHPVMFVQRPTLFGRTRIVDVGAISLATSGELFHHQLRPWSVLAAANAAVVRRSLAGLASDWQDAALVNFNYDYEFLRDLWPQARILTVINDDFQHTARSWMRSEARRVQRETLRRSDRVFAVSYPLVDQCRRDSEHVDLFLPWSRSGYLRPTSSEQRRDLLYWGFIEHRIDWDLIERLAVEGVRFHFVGPIERGGRARRAFTRPGIEYHGAAALRDIPHVLALCAASILPYDLSKSSLEITMSNRAFEILSHGLPLLYAAFPHLLRAPEGVIRKCTNVADYLAGLEHARANFDALQPSIEAFLSDHTPAARYSQLASALFS